MVILELVALRTSHPPDCNQIDNNANKKKLKSTKNISQLSNTRKDGNL